MPSTFELANISDCVYRLQSYNGWDIIHSKKKLNGFKAAVYANGNERVIAYAGTDDPGDMVDDTSFPLGLIPGQAFDGIDYFQENFDPEYSTTLTGHSLGGSIAAIVGNKYIKNTSTFNSAGTLGLRNFDFTFETFGFVEVTRNENAAKIIHHYLIYQDRVSQERTHLGQTHWALMSKGSVGLVAIHTIGQWLIKDRYDGNGAYDSLKKINNIYADSVAYA